MHKGTGIYSLELLVDVGHTFPWVEDANYSFASFPMNIILVHSSFILEMYPSWIMRYSVTLEWFAAICAFAEVKQVQTFHSYGCYPLEITLDTWFLTFSCHKVLHWTCQTFARFHIFTSHLNSNLGLL